MNSLNGTRLYIDIPASSSADSRRKLLKWRCTPEVGRSIIKAAKCSKEAFENRIRRHYSLSNEEDFTLRLFLSQTPMENIDYEWESRMLYLFMKYLELERLMWNLSTLGGACSAMADYDMTFAKRADMISQKQMKIAAELEDRTLLARCHLYIALSAAQQADFSSAKRIVRIIYLWSVHTQNEFIQACCRGVRAKIKSIELFGTKALRDESRHIIEIEN